MQSLFLAKWSLYWIILFLKMFPLIRLRKKNGNVSFNKLPRIQTHKNPKNNITALGKQKTEVGHEFDYENVKIQRTGKNLKK